MTRTQTTSIAATRFDLAGRVALVTGSTRGIGLAIARAMSLHGARVVITSRKAEVCTPVRDENVDGGGEALAIPCKSAHKYQLAALVDATLAHWEKIDVLVCNAAVNPYMGPLVGIGDDAYDRIMNSNVRSNVWLCNRVIPQMAERRDGAVIIISSIAGLRGTKFLGAYGLSKAADMQLARNLAVEWGHANVRVNCLAPGIIQTDFAKIGVQLKQQSLDSTTAFSKMSGPNNTYQGFDLAMWDWTALIDPDFMLSVVTCAQYGGWSDTGFCNKHYDKMYSQQQLTPNQTKRRQIVWQMQSYLYKQRPYLWLANDDSVSAVSKKWAGFKNTAQGPFNELNVSTMTQVHLK